MKMKEHPEKTGEAAANVPVSENVGSTIEESLLRDGFIMSTVTGVSMLPTLRQDRDRVIIEVPKGRLKPYDIALYKRWDGQYVLHRVLKVRKDHYVIRGDNTFVDEYIAFENVKGVVTYFVRGGMMVDVTDAKYLRYVGLLYTVYPIRKLVWRCRVFGSGVKRKIKHDI